MTGLVEREGWHGPGGPKPPRRGGRWRQLVWAIIYPSRHQHLAPTVSGVLLIVLAFGIGIAAYNAANNILFITLALLLACLILSGMLSWLNFSRLRWRLLFPPSARALQPVLLTIELANDKRLLPAYGLECLFAARPVSDAAPALPQTTFTSRGKEMKAIWRRPSEVIEGRLHQRGRIDAGGASMLDWAWTPTLRGKWEVELLAVGSLFPFGFFHKKLGASLRRSLIVWPEPISYQPGPALGLQQHGSTAKLPRAGTGSDLLALRRYATGDSHRLIHWKASARSGHLLVRQFAAEAAERHTVHLCTDMELWPRPEQFEMAVRLTATLVEDLFHAGRLHSVMVDQDPPRLVRHIRELETVLDELAVRKRRDTELIRVVSVRVGQNTLITLEPQGTAGVRAHCNDRTAATA